MPGIVRIVKDFEEGTVRLRGHGVEAGLEGGEEPVNVLGSDGDADVKAYAGERVRILNTGRHDARMPAEL